MGKDHQQFCDANKFLDDLVVVANKSQKCSYLFSIFRRIHELISCCLGMYWFDDSTAEDLTQTLDFHCKEITLAQFYG